jgi:hypothetical protein
VKITFYLSQLLVLALVLLQPVHAQTTMRGPNWDRAMAIRSAASIDSDNVLKTLYLSARTGESEQLLNALIAIEHNDDWPVPAREQTIWSFTLGLSDMDFNSIGPKVLDYLSEYAPRTLVAHDDRNDMGVPLFNIQAAAAGARNSWVRQQASLRAEILFQKDTPAWIEAFLQAGPVERKGFADALLLDLGHLALEHLGDQPGLTAIAGKSALILGDREMLEYTIALGSGPDLHPVLKASSMSLDSISKKELLFLTIHLGPDNKAGLAIAHLVPALLDDPEVRDSLFGMLGNSNLGSSAALVLGASPDPEIQNRLSTLAGGKNDLVSRRASMAIDIRPDPRQAPE